MTFGEKAVSINFIHPIDPAVLSVKKVMAAAIDLMDNFRERPGLSGEHRRLANIAITELQGAQMWMVKAITWDADPT